MAEEKKPTGTGKSADSSKAAGAAKKKHGKSCIRKENNNRKKRGKDGSESEKNCEADGAGGRDDSDSKGGKKNVTGSIGNG